MKKDESALCLDIDLVAFYVMLFLQDVEGFADEVLSVGGESTAAERLCFNK